MGRVSVVKGTCTSAKCVRRAKTLYECEKCDLPMRACSYHRQRVLDEMKSHLIDTHPKAVEAAGQAYDKIPVEQARIEKILASPTLQKVEKAKRWGKVGLVAVATLVVLGALTWLKLRHFR
jgi:hypothetical protein